jgi:thiamine phosphate synthase YjbQ (UPF0047 family)
MGSVTIFCESIAVDSVRDGRLKLGTWQQVVVINHDNHSRTRTVEISIVGTTDK